MYCALPGRIRPRSLLSVALTYAAAPGPVTISLPRWLTSKTPTASRTAVCSLTTPEGYSSGIDQPPNSANLAPSATCRSCSGDCRSGAPALAAVSSAMPANLHRHARDAATGVARRDYRAPVTTLPPARREPGQDPGRRRGRRSPGRTPRACIARRRGRRRRRRPSARSLRAAAEHPRLHRQGRRGARVPTGGTIATPAPGAGRAWARDRRPRRRAPRRTTCRRRRRRSTANAASSPSRCLPTTPAWSATSIEGYLLGGYVVLPLPVEGARTSRRAPSPCSARSPGARRSTAAFDDAQVVATAVNAVRDWVNTPAGDLTPPLFADEISRRGQGHQGQGHRARRAARWPSSAAAACSASAAGRARHRGWSSCATPPPTPVAHLALVGKGITFDSGGLTIKTGGRDGRP